LIDSGGEGKNLILDNNGLCRILCKVFRICRDDGDSFTLKVEILKQTRSRRGIQVR
jgi:hypothetical protein